MRWNGVSAAVLCLSLAGGTGACGQLEPYVYKLEEFDRDAPGFNKTPSDRNSVAVCYGRLWASPSEVANVAKAECHRYGKEARLVGASYFRDCAVLTPVLARFDCVTP